MSALRHFRFACIALIAALCLLGMQQGAAFHGLSHLAGDGSSETQKHGSHANSCDKCVVYAEVSGAGPTTDHPALPVPSPVVGVAMATRTMFPARTLPVYSARAPPALL